MANRTIRTPEKEAALLDALRERPSYAAACRKAKVGRVSFYDWKRDDPEFAQRVIEARNEGLDAIEDALASRALKNDTTAAIFLLKSHRRQTYGDKLDVNHGGQINQRIRINLSNLSDEMLDKLEPIVAQLQPEAAN